MLAFFCTTAFCQVIIDSSGVGGFETGNTFALNNWTEVNSGTNDWVVGSNTKYSGNNSAYISSNGSTYDFDNSTASISHFYTDVDLSVVASNITLSFFLKENKSSTDSFVVYVDPLQSNPSPGSLPTGTIVYNQLLSNNNYVRQNIDLTNYKGSIVRIIFTWVNNNDGSGSMPASVDNISVTYCSDPIAYNVTGGGSYCAGGTGVNIGLSDSENGTIYQLWLDGNYTGTSVTGTGNPINFGLQTTGGNYTVVAFSGTCSTVMNGSKNIVINSIPSAPTGTPGERCGTGVVSISATSASNTINWFSAPSGGSALATGTNYNPSISSTTIYYAEALTADGCVSATRTTVTATINPIPSAPTGTPGERCGTGVVGISATSASNTINWFSAPSGGSALATGTNYNPSISSTTIYYAEALTSDGCISATRTAVTATINPIPSAPTGTDGQRCGTGAVGISAISATNTINWFSASSGGSSIGTSASGATFNTPSISGTTIYYAEALTPDGCISATRTAVTATVNSAPAITTQPVTQTVCSGSPATFSVVASGSPSPTYQWQNPSVNIAGATNPSYSTNVTGSYKVVATNICGTATSNTVTLSNYTALVAGGINTSSVTACSNYNPPVLDINSPLTSGGSGSYNYQWQLNSGNIGANLPSYDPPNLVATGAYNYNCIITDAVCNTSVTTTTKTITIVTDPTVSITNGSPVCPGTALTLTANVTGGTGSNLFQWQSAPAVGGPYTDIVGATAGTYPPHTSVAGTFYYKVIRSGGAGCSLPTANATVTINPLPATNLTVGGSGAICSGTGTNITVASSVSGTTYQLRNNAGNVNVGSAVNGSSGTINLPTGNLIANTTFNVLATITATGCNAQLTQTATVTINPLPAINLTVGGSGAICSGTGTNITVASSVNGTSYLLRNNAGNVTIGSAVNGNGGSINLPTGNLTTNTTFNILATITATGCNTQLTQTATVTIDPLTVGGSVASSAIVCYNANSGSLTLSGHTGSVTKWESSVNGGGAWSTIINTTTSQSYTNLTQTTLYRAVVQSGTCSAANSGSASISVNQPFTPTFTSAPSPICLGQTVTLTASGFSAADTITGGDFSVNSPPGWAGVDGNANNNNGSTPCDWGRTNGGKSYSSPYNFNSNTGSFMVVAGATTDILETPAFSSVGKTSLLLEWYQGYSFTTGTTGKVEISVNGGITYTTLVQYTGISTELPTNPFTTKRTIDLSAYLGQSNLKIRFNYVGTAGSVWAIDNVNVTGNYQLLTYTWPSGFTVSGSSATVTPSTTGNITYTISTSYGGCAATSTTTSIFVNDTVKITAQALSSIFCAGTSASIPATVTGATTYLWAISTTGIAGTYTNLTNTAPYSSVTTSTLTVNPAPVSLGNNYYRLSATGTCGTKTTTPVQLRFRNLWTGATSSDWNNTLNWADGTLPSAACDTVYLPNKTNQPILKSAPNATIKNLLIYSGTTLKLDSSTITKMQISGSITNNGTFDVTNGAIEFNGTSQTIPANVFYTNKIKDLIINSNVTLAGQDSITGTLSFPGSSKTFTTNNNLTLKSTANYTATVGQIINSNKITDSVYVERYLSAKRAWRFLSIPTKTNQTIKKAWQEGATSSGQNPISANQYGLGYGTQITDTTATLIADGFDYYSPAGPSVKTYDPLSNQYKSIPKTTIPISTTEGYMTFWRGDRTAIGYYATPTAGVLRTKGILLSGDQPPYSVPANQFKAIGNPYAAPLDMRTISKTGTVQNFFYVWDPNLTSGLGLGAFQTFTKIGSDYYPTPGFGSYTAPVTPYNYIHSGLAFFVAGGASGGTLTISESCKSAAAAAGNLPMYRPVKISEEALLRTNMFVTEANGEKALVDGTLQQFNDSYSNMVDDMDAKKQINFGENLAIKNDTALLVIERRKTIADGDTIHLAMYKMKAKAYHFAFQGSNFDPLLTAYLEDTYTHTKTPLNLTDTTTYNFTVENIPGSWNPERFRIVFTNVAAGPLPVTFTRLNALQQDKDIAVNWQVENENNIREYWVERSADGIHFSADASVASSPQPNGSAGYTWIDKNAKEGYHYYRIRSIGLNGEIKFSNVVKIMITKERPQIEVYPNPVKDGIISLHLINQPRGIYNIKLMTKTGQLIMMKAIDHEEGSSIEEMKIKLLAHGTYHLEITKPGNGKTNISVVF